MKALAERWRPIAILLCLILIGARADHLQHAPGAADLAARTGRALRQVQGLMAQTLFTGLAVVVDTLARLVVLMVFQLPTLAWPLVCSTFAQQTLLSILWAPCVYYGLQSVMQYGQIRPDKG